MVNCKGPCDQGRKPCPIPCECERTLPPRLSRVMVALLLMWCVGMIVFAFLARL